MAFHPYLTFDGNCGEAFARYHEILGGDLEIMKMGDLPPGEAAEVPPEQADLVMHAALKVGDGLLMGSDDPTGGYKGVEGTFVSYSADGSDEVARIHGALVEGGDELMAVTETFWSPAFGMCRDRYGVLWMVGAEPEES